MLPGSQSAKLKQATLGISGDPRFRLISTLPKGPWVFLIVIGLALAIAVVVMMLAGGAQDRQENVIAVHDCVASIQASIDHNTKVLDEAHAAAAAPCFDTLLPIGDATPDTLVPAIKASLADVRRLHQEGKSTEEIAATFKLLDQLDEFVRWYIQNKARYSIH